MRRLRGALERWRRRLHELARVWLDVSADVQLWVHGVRAKLVHCGHAHGGDVLCERVRRVHSSDQRRRRRLHELARVWLDVSADVQLWVHGVRAKLVHSGHAHRGDVLCERVRRVHSSDQRRRRRLHELARVWLDVSADVQLWVHGVRAKLVHCGHAHGGDVLCERVRRVRSSDQRRRRRLHELARVWLDVSADVQLWVHGVRAKLVHCGHAHGGDVLCERVRRVRSSDQRRRRRLHELARVWLDVSADVQLWVHGVRAKLVHCGHALGSEL